MLDEGNDDACLALEAADDGEEIDELGQNMYFEDEAIVKSEPDAEYDAQVEIDIKDHHHGAPDENSELRETR